MTVILLMAKGEDAQNIRIVLYAKKSASYIEEYYHISQVQQRLYHYADIFREQG